MAQKCPGRFTKMSYKINNDDDDEKKKRKVALRIPWKNNKLCCVCFVVQEHIEELSSLNRVRLRDDDDGEGVAARLRRQLQAKDEELRQVQRNMVQWKEKTTARLARKFEQELTCELERLGQHLHLSHTHIPTPNHNSNLSTKSSLI